MNPRRKALNFNPTPAVASSVPRTSVVDPGSLGAFFLPPPRRNFVSVNRQLSGSSGSGSSCSRENASCPCLATTKAANVEPVFWMPDALSTNFSEKGNKTTQKSSQNPEGQLFLVFVVGFVLVGTTERDVSFDGGHLWSFEDLPPWDQHISSWLKKSRQH